MVKGRLEASGRHVRRHCRTDCSDGLRDCFGGILYQKVAIVDWSLQVDKGKESKVYVFVQQSQSHSRRQLGVIH